MKEVKKKKKAYVKPEMHVEEFTPNEYIAACETTPGYTTYLFECTAGNSNSRYYVYDESGNTLCPNRSLGNGYFRPCDATHEVKVPDGGSLSDYFKSGTIESTSYGGHGGTIDVWIWPEGPGEYHCMPKTDTKGNTTAPTKNMS